MRELTEAEIEHVSGAGAIGDGWDDIKRIIGELPDVYDRAILSTTDMMCRGTGNC